MKYTYKERVRLAKKLKIFLAILFIATISLTAYLISKNTYADVINNGVLKIELDSEIYTATVRVDGIPIENVHIYGENNDLLGITNNKGKVTIAEEAYSSPSYIKIGEEDKNLTVESLNSIYTFNYQIPLIGEAYAEYDTSNGQLRIFRDEEGLYTNGQKIGTKTYYTGIETITGTSQPKWYTYRSTIKNVIIENYFRPRTAYKLFYQCSELTSITGIEKLITTDIDNMSYMFYQCKKLENLEVSNFDTRNVTDMSSMFANCEILTTLDVSEFYTNNVTNMYYMFYSCKNLTDLNLLSFNTENVRDTSYMFCLCENIRSLDLSSFDMTNVTNTFWMFKSMYSIKGLTLGTNFKFNQTESLPGSWTKDNNITIYTGEELMASYDGTTMAGTYVIPTISHAILYENGDMVFQRSDTPDPEKGNVIGVYTGFETSIYEEREIPWRYDRDSVNKVIFKDVLSPISIAYWFYGMKNLNVIEKIDTLDTSHVTTMAGTFHGCSNLKTINLSNFDTNNVTDMHSMFYNCSNLKKIDVSSFNTSNVTSMAYMFDGCSSLKSLNLETFDTSQVTSMSDMFNKCSNLKSIDLSSFDTSNVKNMSNMFDYCESLKKLDLSNFNTSNVTRLSSIFRHCISLEFIDITSFDVSKVASFYEMFSNCESLKSLDLSRFDTSSATDMYRMFIHCEKLTSLDLSSFNTSKVTDMREMFWGCQILNILDLSSFDTSKVKMNSSGSKNMFFYCWPNVIKLGTNWGLDSLSGFNTNCTTDKFKRDGDDGEYTGYQLTNLYDGTTMAGTYRRMSITMYAMLYDNGELVFQKGNAMDEEKGTLENTYTGFDRLTYTNASSVPWYSDRNSITKVTFKDEIAPVSTAYWFYGMTNLNKFNNISNLNTIFTTTTKSMFENCTKLTSFNMNNIETNSLVNMNSMFKGCTNLQSLNMSDFEAKNLIDVTDIITNTNLKTLTLGNQSEFNILPTLSGDWKRDNDSSTYTGNGVFGGPAGIYRLTASTKYAIIYDNGEMVFQEGNIPDPTKGNVLGTYTGFETNTNSYTNLWYPNRTSITKIIFETEISPISMYGWFYGMQNLTEIENIEYLNTENVTDMSNMFYGCSSLTSLDLSNFDTSKVKTMWGMFQNCNNLINLDLSNFDTANVTNMACMFDGCKKLENLEINNINTSNVTTMSSMFRYCNKLNFLDISSFDTSKVTDMGSMFDGCNSLTELDLNNFDTTKVKDMSIMFASCTNLININISSFDTSSVTNMSSMFSGCSSLTELDLNDFDTANVTNMNNMFYQMIKLNTLKLGTNWKFLSDNKLSKSWLRDGDTIIYTAEELTDSYNGSTMAGTYRAVQKLTITETVKGSLADINKNFDFTINVQNNGVGINTTHAYTGTKSGNLVFSNGVASFTLKHNDSISTYLPDGVNYTITQNSDGYILAKTNDTGTLDSDKTASFINTLNGTTPTGVFLNLIPYIIMLIIGTTGLLWIRSFKRI